MVAQAAKFTHRSGHIRPFILHRDLGDLATLIELGFGQELATTGSRMVEEMRQMASWGPLLYLLRFGVVPFQGYVWVEDDRVVGNISISHERSGTWTLSNIAVLPEFRGRGIGSKLLDRAIDHVSEQGGKYITLQVRADNKVAVALYEHRGMVTYDSVHEMSLSSRAWPIVVSPPLEGVRGARRADRKYLDEITRESAPSVALISRHPTREQGPRQLWARILGGLGRVLQAANQVETVYAPSSTPAGYAVVHIRILGSYHELRLHVMPGSRGTAEQVLLEAVFDRLQGYPRREVRAVVSESHPEAITALQRFGFTTQRILRQMGLTL